MIRSPYDEGLGVAPVIIAEGVQVVTGLLSNKKDPERLKQNQAAYQLALSGNQNAMEFLKYRSGRFGTTDSISPAYEGGGPIGGWATQVAQNDAWRLYQSALAAFGISPEEGGGESTQPQPGEFGIPGGMSTAGYGGTMGLVLAAGIALALLARKRR